MEEKTESSAEEFIVKVAPNSISVDHCRCFNNDYNIIILYTCYVILLYT